MVIGRDLDRNTYMQCTWLVCALRTRVITMSTASWTGLNKKKMEIRDEPEQSGIRSMTVTHQFNAFFPRFVQYEKGTYTV